MHQEYGRKAQLHKIGRQLEGGVIFQITSDNAVYLPIGCIHTVFTIHGGFLFALDLLAPNPRGTYGILFNPGFDKTGREFQKGCLDRSFESIDMGLLNQLKGNSVQAWLVAEHGREHVGWQKKAVVVWNNFFGNKEVQMNYNCPCCIESLLVLS